MRAVRRLYFYIVAFISLQVILWGLITLAASTVDSPIAGGLSNLLARGLAQVLVGLPFFLLHWSVIQKDVRQQAEEQQTFIRAVYGYGLQLATLVPVLTNLHALLRRPLMMAFNVFPTSRNFLAGQSVTDNLVSIALNLITFYFAYRITRADWDAFPSGRNLSLIRRLYRYIWLVIGISSLVVGLQQILFTIFFTPEGIGRLVNLKLASGISVTLIATAIWVITTRKIIPSLRAKAERDAILRTIFLFLANLAGLAIILSIIGVLVNDLLRWLLGTPTSLPVFINAHSSLLAVLIPITVIWLYYRRNFGRHLNTLEDPIRSQATTRLFTSLLSLAGNILVFAGVWSLLSLAVDGLIGDNFLFSALNQRLANGLALLAVGLPLWINSWPLLQREATGDNQLGERARQSVVRKTFLYLLIFAAVVGLMAAVGLLVFRLINSVLGNAMPNFGLFVIKQLLLSAQITVWLLYHLAVLRKDNRAEKLTIKTEQPEISVLLLTDPDSQAAMSSLQAMIQKEMPYLALTLHTVSAGVTTDTPEPSSIMVLPASSTWQEPVFAGILKDFSGKVILIPLADKDGQLVWAGMHTQEEEEILKSALQLIRQAAEGQPFKISTPANGWAIAGYVLAGLVGLQVLFVVFALLASLVMN